MVQRKRFGKSSGPTTIALKQLAFWKLVTVSDRATPDALSLISKFHSDVGAFGPILIVVWELLLNRESQFQCGVFPLTVLISY
jgi:hypothetical protein